MVKRSRTNKDHWERTLYIGDADTEGEALLLATLNVSATMRDVLRVQTDGRIVGQYTVRGHCENGKPSDEDYNGAADLLLIAARTFAAIVASEGGAKGRRAA